MTKSEFEAFWNEKYVPLKYEDVKNEYEDFVKSCDNKIFIEDYEVSGSISRDDFIDNLSQTAQFTFQDTLTEVFYDKNPEVYETAFALYEEAQLSGKGDDNEAILFHEEFNRLYKEFLLEMFDNIFG